MRTIEGSFAFIACTNKLNPHVCFIFKNKGQTSFFQYSTVTNSKIQSIYDFKIATPIVVLEVVKNKKHFDNYSQVYLGNFTGIQNILTENEILVFSSNVIPGKWKLFTRMINQRLKEYYIVRLE